MINLCYKYLKNKLNFKQLKFFVLDELNFAYIESLMYVLRCLGDGFLDIKIIMRA